MNDPDTCNADTRALLALRQLVDSLDRELLSVLRKRWQALEEIRALKQQLTIAAVDPQREAELLSLWSSTAIELGLPPTVARAVLATVLEQSRSYVGAGADPR
jgi:chorismate mutase